MSDIVIVVIGVLAALMALMLMIYVRRIADQISAFTLSQGVDLERTERLIREEMSLNRKEATELAKQSREELSASVRNLIETVERKQESLREKVEQRLEILRRDNSEKLEEMRKTVDEKLHDTLEKRLGESFKVVSERLEAVQRGLGEMQNLATGVGDLKRVLTNVKSRGTWGEVQLGALLEQILAPGQYEKNVRTKPHSRELVEYAIRLPGPKDDPDACVWLPIDSKFPQEDYLRIQDAAELGDSVAVQKATEALSRSIKASAQDIHDKYINPPRTTDFGIMFLATEGLYAEVLRQPALVEQIQLQWRIVVAGPTSLAAILSSLRMGFQTLAIEQRAAEVWKVLSAVKTEFGKFGDVLEKVKRQLSTATRTIEQTGVRTRAMERRLRSVEELPESEASQILGLPETSEMAEIEEKEAEPNSEDWNGSGEDDL